MKQVNKEAENKQCHNDLDKTKTTKITDVNGMDRYRMQMMIEA